MAITRSGSVTQFNGPTTNTGSTTVTVPADAEVMVVGVCGYPDAGGASYFSGGSLTLNSVAFTVVAGDTDNSAFEGSLFYLVSPATGSQTLAWDWAGTDTIGSFGPILAYAFYKGVDTANLIRSSSGSQQASNPHTSATLTAQTGDLIVAWGWQFADATNRTVAWTGATEQLAITEFASADGSWAEASPTGNQTVSFSCAAFSADGGVTAIVLKPASGGTDVTINPTGFGLTASLGNPIVNNTITVFPAGFGLTASLGSPQVNGGVRVSPAGFGLTATLGTLDIRSDTTVLLDGFGLTASLGTPTPTVSGGGADATVTPSGFGLTASLGTPTLAFPIQTIVPGGFQLEAQLGSPTVTGATSAAHTRNRSRRFMGGA